MHKCFFLKKPQKLRIGMVKAMHSYFEQWSHTMYLPDANTPFPSVGTDTRVHTQFLFTIMFSSQSSPRGPGIASGAPQTMLPTHIYIDTARTHTADPHAAPTNRTYACNHLSYLPQCRPHCRGSWFCSPAGKNVWFMSRNVSDPLDFDMHKSRYYLYIYCKTMERSEVGACPYNCSYFHPHYFCNYPDIWLCLAFTLACVISYPQLQASHLMPLLWKSEKC